MYCDNCRDATPTLGLELYMDRRGRQRLTVDARPAYRAVCGSCGKQKDDAVTVLGGPLNALVFMFFAVASAVAVYCFCYDPWVDHGGIDGIRNWPVSVYVYGAFFAFMALLCGLIAMTAFIGSIYFAVMLAYRRITGQILADRD